MKAVVRYLDATKGCTMLPDLPIPAVPPEHLLIKVMASPINPCDELFINGKYTAHQKKEPFVCGYEGSGIVAAIGEGSPKE